VKRTQIIIVIAVLLLTFAGLLALKSHRKQYYAAGRLFVEFPNGNYNYSLYLTNLQAISNVLCSVETSNRLAAVSQFQSGNFVLMKVPPIRGAWAVQLVYVGSDQNGIERITSNACVIVQQFLATNQPGCQVTHVETSRIDPPKPDWWRWASEARDFFQR
jgi:hypothetical protein